MPSLMELLSGGLRQPHMSSYGGNPKLPTTLMDLISEKSAQPAFGMDPKVNRLNLLPRYSQSEGMVAPDVLYSLAQALSAPGMAARGQEQGPMAGMNVALNAFGFGVAQPNMGGLGANAGMTKPLVQAVDNVKIGGKSIGEDGYKLYDWVTVDAYDVKDQIKRQRLMYRDGQSLAGKIVAYSKGTGKYTIEDENGFRFKMFGSSMSPPKK